MVFTRIIQTTKKANMLLILQLYNQDITTN